MHPRNRRVHTLLWRPLLIAALAAILLPFVRDHAAAQFLPPPLRSPLGYPDSQFVVMAISQTHSDSVTNRGNLWLLLDALGIDVVEQYGYIEEKDSLASSPLRKASQKMISKFEPIVAGHGIELQLYPFTTLDTTQSPFYVSKFLYRSAGAVVRNASAQFLNFREQQYDSSNTTPGQLVDSGVAFDWHAGQTLRSQIAAYDLLKWANGPDARPERTPFSIVAVGHIVAPLNNTIPDSTRIFRIELYQEIIAGDSVLATPTTLAALPHDTLILLRTGFVTHGDLINGVPSVPLDVYRESIAVTDSLLWRPDGAPGPFHQNQPQAGRRLEIKVYWLGGEPVALRSINLRDHVGQRVLGATQESIDYRDSIIRSAYRDLYGTTTPVAIDPLRSAWARFYSGDEPNVVEGAAYAYMDTMLLRRFTAIHAADSIRLFTGEVDADRIPAFYHRAVTAEVVPEMYGGWDQDTSRAFGVSYDDPLNIPRLQYDFNTPYWCMPRFKEHNGGRWHNLMLLSLDSARNGLYTESTLRDRINKYELSMQRGKLGWFQPTVINWSWKLLPLQLLSLGAVTSRDSSRPMIASIGGNGYVTVRADGAGNLDTMVKFNEPNEIRVQVNLALCYGARGIRYNVLGDFRDFMTYDAVHNRTTGNMDNFGLMGGRLGDTTFDAYPEPGNAHAFQLTTADSVHVVTLDSLYIGYRSQTRELRSLNSWLHRVGRELCGLRWRDAFSAHMATAVTGTTDSTVHARPLDDMVTGVTSRDPYTGVLDADTNTFVELGMFYPKLGIRDREPYRPYDTNYLFVVNRRVFEAPDTLRQDTAYNVLHHLSGTRQIALKFNLPHPDQSQYNFLHITELAPDTTRLPGTSFPRTGLDTIIFWDSLAVITLRPGGGALLMVRYAPPDTSLDSADIRFNNQRKMVYDGQRYHAVYHHGYTFNNGITSESSEGIYYRRSEIMRDTSGAILWEPVEYRINSKGNVILARGNTFPSLTLHKGRVIVVWSGYGTNGSALGHDIWLRDIVASGSTSDSSLTIDTTMTTEYVGFAAGADSTQWGTPVVSSLDAGVVVAWSDSTKGIMARLRRGSSSWSDSTKVSNGAPLSYSTGAQYASMPPFAHVQGLDSNIGIVWQQAISGGNSDIYYRRLVDRGDSAGHPRLALGPSGLRLNQDNKHYMHPSIDQAQDYWYEVQEGVTWELPVTTYNVSTHKYTFNTAVYFSSLNTETRLRPDSVGNPWNPFWDSLQASQQWTLNSLTLTGGSGSSLSPVPPRYVWPNTSSLNARTDLAHVDDLDCFSLVTSASDRPSGASLPMKESLLQYAINFVWPSPKTYLWGGYAPNGSASPVGQRWKHGTLYAAYDALDSGASKTQTSRQFYAKERPTGYMAQGRKIYLRISDSLRTGISGMMHDVWFAGDAGTGPAEMITRPLERRQTDTLSQARELFRTRYFTAHDSTTIGCRLSGEFYGDSAAAAGISVTYVTELVDSVTEQAVALIDSFVVGPTTIAERDTTIEAEHDLLSGTYYVRMRIEPTNLPDMASESTSRYPVEETASWVEEPHAGKLRRIDGETGAQGRLSVSPNPASSAAEIVFSVPGRARVSLALYSVSGREALRPVEPGMMDAGRYAIDIDGSVLTPGTYLVRMRYGSEQLVEKLVIIR